MKLFQKAVGSFKRKQEWVAYNGRKADKSSTGGTDGLNRHRNLERSLEGQSQCLQQRNLETANLWPIT